MTTSPSDDHVRARARSFDAAAVLYGANRPGYPAELFDAVEELAGRPLDGARVADVGAGTGIASALLEARGARVVGVEPGDGMAAEFRRARPGIPLVRGTGTGCRWPTAPSTSSPTPRPGTGPTPPGPSPRRGGC